MCSDSQSTTSLPDSAGGGRPMFWLLLCWFLAGCWAACLLGHWVSGLFLASLALCQFLLLLLPRLRPASCGVRRLLVGHNGLRLLWPGGRAESVRWLEVRSLTLIGECLSAETDHGEVTIIRGSRAWEWAWELRGALRQHAGPDAERLICSLGGPDGTRPDVQPCRTEPPTRIPVAANWLLRLTAWGFPLAATAWIGYCTVRGQGLAPAIYAVCMVSLPVMAGAFALALVAGRYAVWQVSSDAITATVPVLNIRTEVDWSGVGDVIEDWASPFGRLCKGRAGALSLPTKDTGVWLVRTARMCVPLMVHDAPSLYIYELLAAASQQGMKRWAETGEGTRADGFGPCS